MRIALPFLFLFAAIVTVWAVVQVMPDAPAESAEVQVVLVHPNGTIWYDISGLVAEPASALGALEALAGRVGLDLIVTEHAAFGDCGAFVEAIGGHGPAGSHGWVYDLWDADAQQFVPGSVGAACGAIRDGDLIRWRYGTE